MRSKFRSASCETIGMYISQLLFFFFFLLVGIVNHLIYKHNISISKIKHWNWLLWVILKHFNYTYELELTTRKNKNKKKKRKQLPHHTSEAMIASVLDDAKRRIYSHIIAITKNKTSKRERPSSPMNVLVLNNNMSHTIEILNLHS